MAKKSRTTRETTPAADGINPRAACPCGSGKRYKACHGAPGGGTVFSTRPFEGMPSEPDVIALRELVPAATASLTLKSNPDQVLRLTSLLPMAAPAMVRESGQIWLGMQVQHHYGDPARDLGAVLEAALAETSPGVVGLTSAPGAGARLQDLISNTELDVAVHTGFDFWIDDLEDTDGSLAAALEQANEAAMPTERLNGLGAAYWTNVGTKEHLRWVMPESENELLDALARLHAAGQDNLIETGRLVGMFRAHGLLAPVWDLPVGTGAEVLQAPAEAFKRALDDALASTDDLSAAERSARAGLANRQVTIR